MLASFPYLNRTYSQAAPGPQAAAAMRYSPYGAGSGPLPQSKYMTPPPNRAPRAETNITIPGAYHNA